MDKETKNKTTKELMNRIIQKGGLFGEIACDYSNDIEKSTLFILVCADQSHSELTTLYWGEELIRDIENYKNNFKK